jgi:hypothetical protein
MRFTNMQLAVLEGTSTLYRTPARAVLQDIFVLVDCFRDKNVLQEGILVQRVPLFVRNVHLGQPQASREQILVQDAFLESMVLL